MAQRKIKIALSSTLADPPAIAAMWLDNDQFEFGLDVPNGVLNPLVSEYTFEATGVHILKIAMVNDFFDGIEDLNLVVNYVALANEDGTYTPYTYIAYENNLNFRTDDGTALVTGTIWYQGSVFEMTFDVNNLQTWFDWDQYNVDNPPAP